MTKNHILKQKTMDDIDRRVERVLQDVGNPEPPLNLDDVRELLKLDRGYYTADDPSVARKVASRIRVGVLQVFKRPALLADIIKSLDVRGFYIPDQKRILIDKSQPEPKHRWLEAHEIGHSLLPWHEDVMFGDSKHTLSPQCHDAVESEANFGAARLLFLRDHFSHQASDYAHSINSVKLLKPIFGNTYTTTFWRCIETWGADRPMVGLITGHPHPSKRTSDFDPNAPCRHVIQSPAFGRQFSRVNEILLFNLVSKYCTRARGGPLGYSELAIDDDNGESHIFTFETFSFFHDVLTLGAYSRPHTRIVRIGDFR